MIYVIILSVWLGINWIVDVIDAVITSKNSGAKFGHFVGTTFRYIAWAWLIYKITQIY